MTATRLRSIGELFDWAVHVVFGRGWAILLLYAPFVAISNAFAAFVGPQSAYALFVNSMRSASPNLRSALHEPSASLSAPAPHWFVAAAIGIGILSTLGSTTVVLAARTAFDGDSISALSIVVQSLSKFARVLVWVIAVAVAAILAVGVFLLIVVVDVIAIVGLGHGPATTQQNLALGVTVLVEIVLALPLFVVVQSLSWWSFVDVCLGDTGGFRAVVNSFGSICRRRTFWRATGMGAATIALFLFANLLEFGGSVLALQLWNSRWLEAVVSAVPDIIVASVTLTMYVAFYLDERARDGAIATVA